MTDVMILAFSSGVIEWKVVGTDASQKAEYYHAWTVN
jgi:hypothetical protein